MDTPLDRLNAAVGRWAAVTDALRKAAADDGQASEQTPPQAPQVQPVAFRGFGGS